MGRGALVALGLLLALAAGLALGPDDGTGVHPRDSGEAAASTAGVDRAPVVPRLVRTANRLIDVRTPIGVVLASAVAAALTAGGRPPDDDSVPRAPGARPRPARPTRRLTTGSRPGPRSEPCRAHDLRPSCGPGAVPFEAVPGARMIAKPSPHLRPVAGRACLGPGPALDAQGLLR